MASQDYHIDPGGHFSAAPDFARTWPVHCAAGTPGAAFHPDLDTSRVDEVFRKGAYTAAYSGFEAVTGDGNTAGRLAGRPRGDRRWTWSAWPPTTACGPPPPTPQPPGCETRVLLGLTAAVDPATARRRIASLRAAGVTLAGTPLAD